MTTPNSRLGAAGSETKDLIICVGDVLHPAAQPATVSALRALPGPAAPRSRQLRPSRSRTSPSEE